MTFKIFGFSNVYDDIYRNDFEFDNIYFCVKYDTENEMAKGEFVRLTLSNELFHLIYFNTCAMQNVNITKPNQFSFVKWNEAINLIKNIFMFGNVNVNVNQVNKFSHFYF